MPEAHGDGTPTMAWAALACPHVRAARFRVAGHAFAVGFHDRGEGVWFRGWSPDQPVSAGSGMFPRIDAALRVATLAFLSDVAPVALLVEGADAKRNAHNAATYGTWAPTPWTVRRILHPGHARADATGCVGVALVDAARFDATARARLLLRGEELAA
jgi:hypothetical protein